LALPFAQKVNRWRSLLRLFDNGSGTDGRSGLARLRWRKILLDPYAEVVYFPKGFSRGAAIRKGSNVGQAPLGILLGDEPQFDWSDERRPRHESDLIIYETHVRGFTRRVNSGVDASRRGTFAGVIDKIPYLKELGVTAVELMPVFQFDPDEENYWGYMPLNFFSPHSGFCSSNNPLAHRNEFRAMVKALHSADIEVILDVVRGRRLVARAVKHDTWAKKFARDQVTATSARLTMRLTPSRP
jgi:pullulanase/glycogen debranching enzyme